MCTTIFTGHKVSFLHCVLAYSMLYNLVLEDHIFCVVPGITWANLFLFLTLSCLICQLFDALDRTAALVH